MKRFGLIGRKLGHSYSRDYFARKFVELGLKNYSYELFELPSVEGLKAWALREGLSGFNVTVPYKQEVIPQLDALDEVATAVGAVNCVTIENGRLVGHNTDAPAFRDTLEDLLNTKHITLNTAFILGTGGAARAVAYALGQLGIGFTFVSRHPGQHDNAISYDCFCGGRMPAALGMGVLIVNATPVGMYPNVDQTPLDLSSLQMDAGRMPAVHCYDLVYNPSPTRLLHEAVSLGCGVKDGLEMLHRQADLSWGFFNLASPE